MRRLRRAAAAAAAAQARPSSQCKHERKASVREAPLLQPPITSIVEAASKGLVIVGCCWCCWLWHQLLLQQLLVVGNLVIGVASFVCSTFASKPQDDNLAKLNKFSRNGQWKQKSVLHSQKSGPVDLLSLVFNPLRFEASSLEDNSNRETCLFTSVQDETLNVS